MTNSHLFWGNKRLLLLYKGTIMENEEWKREKEG